MGSLENPIFIVGTGRCGSTVFHHIMSRHPKVAWLTKWNDRFPHNHAVNRLAMNILDSPLPAKFVRKLIFPVEAYAFWQQHCGIFSEPYRDLKKSDVSPSMNKTIRRLLSEQVTENRKRLLVKITGWPRLGFLKEIFPDAKFINVYRDGRAVANSYLQVWFWTGWKGPENWRWGPLTNEQKRKWEKFNESYVALAGIEWEILMTAFDEAKKEIPAGDFFEFTYEDLCSDLDSIMAKSCTFLNLDQTDDFMQAVAEFNLRNSNNKMKKDLTIEQQRILNDILNDVLPRYGYQADTIKAE